MRVRVSVLVLVTTSTVGFWLVVGRVGVELLEVDFGGVCDTGGGVAGVVDCAGVVA